MIIVDVETTGLDPKKCSIVSIGAVAWPDTSEVFYIECRVWTGAQITQEALRVNGQMLQQVTDPERSSEARAVALFYNWVGTLKGDMTLGGENPRFDLDFLKAASDRCHMHWPLGYRTVDLHSVCYADHLVRHVPIPTQDGHTALSRDETLAYVGLPPEPLPHKAIRCAKVEAEAFGRLLLGHGLLPEFAGYPVPKFLQEGRN